MTEPPPVSSRWGMPCLQHRNTDRTLTAWTFSHTSSDVSSTEASSGGEMPGVVEQHVDPAVLGADGGERLADRVVVGDVAGQREVHAGGVGPQVDADHRGALLLEAAHGLGADPARGAGDDADLVVQAAHQDPVA